MNIYLCRNCKKTKERGYGLDNEENSIGYSCISAPVFNDEGVAVYGISTAIVPSKLQIVGVTNVAKIIKEYAAMLSKELRYNPE